MALTFGASFRFLLEVSMDRRLVMDYSEDGEPWPARPLGVIDWWTGKKAGSDELRADDKLAEGK